MILEENAFIERVLPGNIIRKLTDEEMAIYRAPFSTSESRVPTWRFPNELPIAGKPADVYSTVEHAHMALSQSTYPKLLFVGDPGVLVSPAFADNFAKKLKNCRVVHLCPGLHYLQEDHPEAIGKATAEWIKDADAIRRNWASEARIQV
jgi:haloalkane dehalogenase